MWFSSLLLLLASTSVMAGFHDELKACIDMVDMEELEKAAKSEIDNYLDVVCPMMGNFSSCLRDAVKRNFFGLSLEQLAYIMEGTDIGKGASVIVNVLNLFDDLCKEGSQLNIDYLADSQCLRRDQDPTGLCLLKATTAYEVYRGIEENVVEVAGDDYDPDMDCMKLAYLVACRASLVHEECGQRAFNTFNTMIKRTSVFKNALCSTEGLENLKTTFLNSLQLEDNEKELFRLAFDLRKRRK